MLNIPGPSSRHCDGVTRRNFLKIGAFAFGATTFSLADLYRAEAGAGASPRTRPVINVSSRRSAPPGHGEIKTEAPAGIRGEFRPIATNVNGIQICEVFQRLSRQMDKCVVIRSVVRRRRSHAASSA